MTQVTYHCPYCGALTGLERDGYLADKCVTKAPLEGWEYASTTEDYESADGVEFVCLGDASGPGGANRVDRESGRAHVDENSDGCGRTFYLSFVRFEDGREVDPNVPLEDYPDRPRFDFRE
jgi:hypothetical protein